MCERRGEVKRARKLYGQSIASMLPAETDRIARTSLARLALAGLRLAALLNEVLGHVSPQEFRR